MKKSLVALFAAVVTMLSCQSTPAHEFVLTGQVKSVPQGSKVYLEELTYRNRKAIDTAELDAKGNFSLKGKIPNNGLYQLRIGEKQAVFLVIDENSGKI